MNSPTSTEPTMTRDEFKARFPRWEHLAERHGGYPKPPGWRNIGRHYLVNTCPVSPHTRMLADELRDKRSPIRKLFENAGYEPDHWASSLEWTVKSLWEARERLKKADPEGERRRSTALLANVTKRLRATKDREAGR